jgi:ERCC4-type nuclease
MENEKKQRVVIADYREPKKVIQWLSKLKVSTIVDKLEIGDYMIPTTMEDGRSFIVERKTTTDLARSIKDGSIWRQLKEIKSVDAEPLLIIEGSLKQIEMFTNWNPLALTSVILTVKYKYGVELFFTPSERWTAFVLTSLARIAQEKIEKRPRKLQTEKKPQDPVEQIRFIVESFPNIGPTLAARLLMKFGSLYNIITADYKQLATVEKLGTKRAKYLYHLFRYDVRRAWNSTLEDFEENKN